MPRFQLRLRVLPRGEVLDDDGEGQRLVALVSQAVVAGGAPLVGVALRADRIDIVELTTPAEDGPRAPLPLPVPILLGGLSRSTADGGGPVEAVGLMGIVGLRAGERSGPLAMVFLEWSDCRWWSWRAAVDVSERRVLPDTAVLNRAVDGDPLPQRLGRWWSLGRRQQLRVHLAAPDLPRLPQVEASPLIH